MHLGRRAADALWQDGARLQLPAAVALALAPPVNEGSAHRRR